MISVYGGLIDNNLTIRDQEAIERYVKLIQWGRANPVQFIEKILQIELMDYQKWLIANTWNKEFAVWVCSRNAGKSFLVGIIMQTRAILYPKSKINIIGAVGRQSCESFETMENIIKNNVKSLIRNNTVVYDEVFTSKADTDGFTHDMKKGSNVKFLNGSEVLAVVGSAKNVVGKRSNMLCFDESGIISQQLFNLVEPFATQSSDFKTGAAYDPEVYPQDIPNLRLYVGSATDTNSAFYAKYREACKQVLAGNDKYFVADLNCEMPLHPKMNGKPIKPLLTQDVIDAKMRENPISAYREYYNIFDRFDQEDAVVSRADIAQYTENYIPFRYGGTKHKYIITYDPASKSDNSPVLVTEVLYPENKEDSGRIKGKLIHMENLIHAYGDGVRKPMTLDEQVQRLRELILYYNGRNTPAYDNVMVLLDAGTGGQAPGIAQELCKDWVDSQGQKHHGLYDEEYPDMLRWAESFPNAVKGSLRLIEPRKYRTQAFDAARALVPVGSIIFPPDVPKSGNVLMVPNIKEGKPDEDVPQLLSKKEMESLLQMHLMNEELCAIVRSKSRSTGVINYGLPPEKARVMHDDRAYCFILMCLWIKMLQDKEVLGEPPAVDFSEMYQKKDPGSKYIKKQTEVSPWLTNFQGNSGDRMSREVSPFQGKNPFGTK